VRVDPEELGMRFWIFRMNVITPIEKGSVEKLAPLIARYCEQSQGRLVRLEVVDQGVALSRNGPVFGLEPQLYAAADVSCE
jgi:hypothetical protein